MKKGKTILYGGISNTPEERAEILYNHPDNDRKEKIIERHIVEYIPVIESNPKTNMFQSNLGIMSVDYTETPQTMYSRDLKQERKDRVNEIRVKQRTNTSQIRKDLKERMDYINKYTERKAAPFFINSDTAIQSEIIMKPKKNERKQKDYEQIAEMFYPEMREESQIKIGNSQKYKLGNQEEYEQIGSVLFPKNTDDEEINRLKEEAKAELRKIEKERWQTHAKNFGGAALEIGSAAIPLATGPRIAVGLTKTITPMLGKKIAQEVSTGIIDGAISGGVYGLGEGLLNGENPIMSTVEGSIIGGVSGGTLGLEAGKVMQLFRGLKLKDFKPLDSMTKEERKEIRKYLHKYYQDYNQGLRVNVPDFGSVLLTARGGQETISKNLECAKDFPNLKRKLQKAKYIRTDSLYKQRKDNIKKFQVFEGEDSTIFIIATDSNGHKYYLTKKK